MKKILKVIGLEDGFSYRNKVKRLIKEDPVKKEKVNKLGQVINKIDKTYTILKYAVKSVAVMIVIGIIIPIIPLEISVNNVSSQEMAETGRNNIHNIKGGVEDGEVILGQVDEEPGETAETAETIIGELDEETTLNYGINSKITEIDYKSAYSVKEGEYIILFTHEECEYCMDLWEELAVIYSEENDKFEELPHLYVIDLKEKRNGTAWTEYKLEGIPLIINYGESVEKYVGSKESLEFILENLGE